MNSGLLRLVAGAGLFALWGALVIFQIPHSSELVQGIVTALSGIGAFHIADSRGSKSQTPTNSTGG